MRVIIQPNYDLVSKWVASYVVKQIRDFKPTPDKPFVLGLPTGSSPMGTYKELIAIHKAGKVSFDEAALLKNFHTIFEAINKAKPASAKGNFIKSVTVSSTMGPGVKVDTKKLV